MHIYMELHCKDPQARPAMHRHANLLVRPAPAQPIRGCNPEAQRLAAGTRLTVSKQPHCQTIASHRFTTFCNRP
eukprot:5364655-Amphidinium_carterae.1